MRCEPDMLLPSSAPLPEPAAVRVRVELDRAQEERIRARAAASVGERLGWLHIVVASSAGVFVAAVRGESKPRIKVVK